MLVQELQECDWEKNHMTCCEDFLQNVNAVLLTSDEATFIPLAIISRSFATE